MVAKHESLQPEIARESFRVRTEGGNYRGYKKDILTEKLSERDNAIFTCPRCKGILRELCLSTDGEQFCSCCRKEGEQIHPNIHMNTMVLCFKCSCPLIVRGCSWLGTLGDCENHLDTCGYVQETCKLKCGVVLQRNDLVTHEKENCVQRIVKCEHCEKNFKFCELPEHLDMCPKMKVSCELKCGMVMCREEVAQHIYRDCKEKDIECPFLKYKCVRLIKRQDLNTHLKEKETEHLKLKLDAIEDIVMKQSELIASQGEMIIQQNQKIETISQENLSLKMTEKQLKILLDPIKLHWEIEKYLLNKYELSQKQFEAAGYLLHFDFMFEDDNLQIVFCLKEGKDDDKLDWPFRSKFITSSTMYLSREPESEIKEFKSDMILVERGDVSSKFRIAYMPLSRVIRPGLLGPFLTIILDI